MILPGPHMFRSLNENSDLYKIPLEVHPLLAKTIWKAWNLYQLPVLLTLYTLTCSLKTAGEDDGFVGDLAYHAVISAILQYPL